MSCGAVRQRGLARATLLALTSMAIVLPGQATAKPAGAMASVAGAQWREAFQSSPRAGLTEAQFADLVARMKIPPPVAEKIRPTTISGTLRYRIPLSIAGTRLRLRFSNEEGSAPLVLGAVSVGLAGEAFDAQPGTLHRVTFGGATAVSVPAGAPFVSDPVDIAAGPGQDVVVSYRVDSPLPLDGNGGSLLALAAGDQTMATHVEAATVITGRPEVTGIAVQTTRLARVIVALGDSITDGNRPSHTALRSWPDRLAQRLTERKESWPFAVVNAGIAGNRVLADGMGRAALTRLDRDALRIDGVTHLLVLEGTNDIAMAGTSVFGANPPLRAEDLIGGYRQILARAHARAIKVIFGTILPTGGSPTHSSPEREALRQAVNRWIRTSGEADGVIDFDAALRDPADPQRLRAAFDSGDHLHPNEAGSRAMGDAVPLSLFR